MFRRLLLSKRSYLTKCMSATRSCTTTVVPVSKATERRNSIFSREQERQMEEVGRLEKIKVEVHGPPEDVDLVMNQDVSTPYECCKHISQGLCNQAALALVNDEVLWDMHRPLTEDCKLKFLTFRDPDPYHVNHAFWRTGSFVLGAIISRVFKSEILIGLQSLPDPQVKTGSFFYDTYLNSPTWIPNEDELRVLNSEFVGFLFENHKIERLRVKKTVAADIFEDCNYKRAEVSNIAASAPDHCVTLYRVDNYIDISNGPMVGSTSFFGQANVTKVHNISLKGTSVHRFQGVALPKGIQLNGYGYNVLLRRAQRLNEAPILGQDAYSLPGMQKNSQSPIPNDSVMSTL